MSHSDLALSYSFPHFSLFALNILYMLRHLAEWSLVSIVLGVKPIQTLQFGGYFGLGEDDIHLVIYCITLYNTFLIC